MVDIDNATGRELDALIAERIMEWKLDPQQKAADGSPLILRELPRYSDEPAAARGVEFFLEQRHPGITLRYERQAPYTVVVRGPSGRDYTATDENEAVAICRAMLKAMEGEGPGIPPAQVQPRRGPRAISAVADLLSRKAQPHQAIGIIARVAALTKGDRKEGAVTALLHYAFAANEVATAVGAQLDSLAGETALGCVAILEQLLEGGESARKALMAAAHGDSEVAKAARRALAWEEDGEV